MSTASGAERRWTTSEYLEMERSSRQRHELREGLVVGMAGATRTHNLLVGNVLAGLHRQLHGRCEVYPSDMRVRTPSGRYTYPDLSVACVPAFEDDRQDTLTNPAVLVEVLSPSTEAYDRGERFEHYRRIASLRDYVLVSCDHVLVEHYQRAEDGRWVLVEARAGERVALDSVGCTVEVDEIYRGALEPPSG